MENKIYYIKGSMENPEGVKQALLEVCPNAKNSAGFDFTNEFGVYYVLDNIMHFIYFSCSSVDVVKKFGIELHPKKQEKFVEKTMYQRILKDELEEVYKDIYGSSMLYPTIEEAMAGQETIGYKEVKVMIKRDEENNVQ